MLAAVVGDLVQGCVENLPPLAKRPLYVRSLWLDRLTEEWVQTLNMASDTLIDASETLFAQGTELEAAEQGKPDARFRYSACRCWALVDRGPALLVHA